MGSLIYTLCLELDFVTHNCDILFYTSDFFHQLCDTNFLNLNFRFFFENFNSQLQKSLYFRYILTFLLTIATFYLTLVFFRNFLI